MTAADANTAPSPTARTGFKLPPPLKLAATLTVFATVAAVLLAVGNQQTAPVIEIRLAEDLKAILSQVVPEDLHDNDLTEATVTLNGPDDKPMTVHQAVRDGDVVAIAMPVTGQGYAGAIKLVMGLNTRHEILGVRVLAHAETPGLGDKIETAKDDWILGFNGLSFDKLSPGAWGVKKDGGTFDQFSGATITPRAVVKAVKQGLAFAQAHHADLFAPPASDAAEPNAPTQEAPND